MTELLISEPPLQVLRSLAVKVGLNEAIALQQLYWLGRRSDAVDGWVERGDWHSMFPWLSERTLTRVWATLRDEGVIEQQAPAPGRVTRRRVLLDSPVFNGRHGGGQGRHDGDRPYIGVREKDRENPHTPLQGASPSSSKSKRKILTTHEEPIGFAVWLTYHAEKSKRQVPRAGTTSRSNMARTFARLLGEGYSPEDFELASDGLLDDWHRETGRTDFSLVLRVTEFSKWVEEGRRVREAGPSESDRLEDKYGRFDG